MIDTMTVLTLLLNRESDYSLQPKLQALLTKSHSIVCEQQIESPALKWKNIPVNANSLALIIKDKYAEKSAEKPRYYWVVYNLSTDIHQLPKGANLLMNSNDVGFNSWGQKKYHAPCFGNKKNPVEIKLIALDKRFSAREKITGEKLEEKINAHMLTMVDLIE